MLTVLLVWGIPSTTLKQVLTIMIVHEILCRDCLSLSIKSVINSLRVEISRFIHCAMFEMFINFPSTPATMRDRFQNEKTPYYSMLTHSYIKLESGNGQRQLNRSKKWQSESSLSGNQPVQQFLKSCLWKDVLYGFSIRLPSCYFFRKTSV
jgi:hypothetical protein